MTWEIGDAVMVAQMRSYSMGNSEINATNISFILEGISVSVKSGKEKHSRCFK